MRKRMTMNIHSHGGADDGYKQKELAEFLLRESPSVVALQEVCQTRSAPVREPPRGFRVMGEEIPLREDNFLLGLFDLLGGENEAVWLPVKVGYGTRDEGLALLTRFPAGEAREILLTPYRPYEDWRRRSALAVSDPSGREWTVSLHMSWWEEGFLLEWNRLSASLRDAPSVWLMGDFNLPSWQMEREGDPLAREGYADAFSLAKRRDEEDTVLPYADGWRERSAGADGLRIDGIRCRPARPVLRYRRIFDGREEPVLSDHFGIMIETEEDEDEHKRS